MTETLERPSKVACRADLELPVSAIARPSGRVSTRYSAFQALSRFAMFIGGVQEPIDQAGAALLHDPDGAVLLSIALQCGVPLDMIRGATTRNPPGPRRCSRKGWRP